MLVTQGPAAYLDGLPIEQFRVGVATLLGEEFGYVANRAKRFRMLVTQRPAACSSHSRLSGSVLA